MERSRPSPIPSGFPAARRYNNTFSEHAVKSRILQEQTLDAEQKKFAVGASTPFLGIQAQRDLSTAGGAEVVAEGLISRPACSSTWPPAACRRPRAPFLWSKTTSSGGKRPVKRHSGSVSLSGNGSQKENSPPRVSENQQVGKLARGLLSLLA
jgi:hypothetical protein